MKKLLFLFVILVAGIANAQTVKNTDDLKRVKIHADAEVEFVNSTSDKVMFNLNEEDLKNFTISTENNSLIVRQNGTSAKPLKIRIYTNSLKALSVKGNTQVSFSKFNYEKSLMVEALNGAQVDLNNFKIGTLNIIRSGDSSVAAEQAKTTKETVDGVLIAAVD